MIAFWEETRWRGEGIDRGIECGARNERETHSTLSLPHPQKATQIADRLNIHLNLSLAPFIPIRPPPLTLPSLFVVRSIRHKKESRKLRPEEGRGGSSSGKVVK